jgi:hypothetical protein
MFGMRLGQLGAVGARQGAAVDTFAVLSSGGDSYTASLAVVDGSGTTYTVGPSVAASDGISYTPI